MFLPNRSTLIVRELAKVKRKFSTNQSLMARGRFEPGQWNLSVALQLQRLPVIVPELNWLEKKMSEIYARMDVNNSLYSDHEMRHFEDVRRAERIASGTKVDEKDLEEAAKQNARDFEEASLAELKQFQFADRVTKADLTNNRRSIDRSLHRYLYLLLKTQVAGVEHWLPPEELHRSSEDKSLRATAERLYNRLFPQPQPSLKSKFLGNAPAGHFEYLYPKKVAAELGKVGNRIFFYKVCLDAGNEPISNVVFGDRVLSPDLEKGNTDDIKAIDFEWLTYEEMKEALPKRLWSAVGSTLYSEATALETKSKCFERSRSKLSSLGASRKAVSQ